MNNQPSTVSTRQLIATLCALVLGCLMEASSDWLTEQAGKNLTGKSILVDTLALLLVILVIGVPVALLFRNRLLAPIFGIPRIRYAHGIIVVTAAYWISGL